MEGVNYAIVMLLAGAAGVMVCRWRQRLRVRRLLAGMRDVRYGRLAAVAEVAGELGEVAREFNDLLGAWRGAIAAGSEAVRRRDRVAEASVRRFQTRIQRLEKQALTDPLTRLGNRELLGRYVQAAFRRAQREGGDLACLMIDLDGFKQVNDVLGHALGDRLLQFTGELLESSLRAGDLAARYGGDEFVLILENCGHKQAVVVAERLRKVFVREARLRLGDEGAKVTQSCSLSIGVATRYGDGARDARELLGLADQALYRAKQQGRNKVAS